MTCAIPLDLSHCVGKRVQNLLHIVFILHEKVLLWKASEGNCTSARKIHKGDVSLTRKFMWLFLQWKEELPESFWNTAACPHPKANSWRGKRMVQSPEVAGVWEGSDWQRKLHSLWWVLSQPSCKSFNSPWICWRQSDSCSEYVLPLWVVKDGKLFPRCVGARPDETKGDRNGPCCNVGVFCLIRQLC